MHKPPMKLTVYKDTYSTSMHTKFHKLRMRDKARGEQTIFHLSSNCAKKCTCTVTHPVIRSSSNYIHTKYSLGYSHVQILVAVTVLSDLQQANLFMVNSEKAVSVIQAVVLSKRAQK